MATPVIVPKIEMAQEKATIVAWLKGEGDRVERGGAVLEVETDKVTMEVEAPATGVLAGLRGEPGDEIPVTETIAYVLEPGEDLPEGPRVVKAGEAPTPSEPAAGGATPVARRLAEAEGVSLGDLTGTGPQGRITRSDVEAALEEGPGVEAARGKVRATPAARRIAREAGVDLAAISGRGPRGRVQADDVRAFVAEQDEAAAPAAEVVVLEGMRRTIAERMTTSYRAAPHIALGIDVDMTAFEEARERLNARARTEGQSQVSVTALLVKAVAWALERHPWLNSTLEDDEIHLLPEVNVGVAVALEAGLIVPVVKEAHRKRVGRIAAEVEELVERARQERLRPSDVAGGTFTISNLGPLGIDEFTAIINPPEAAILAVGAVRPRLVPDGEGGAVARPTMHVTLSADHRIVDGATAARFLNDLREGLEDPAVLLW
jgi:pyruvate dehydrogenase E2 component (dihydrolipoamide acetyltransferase)